MKKLLLLLSYIFFYINAKCDTLVINGHAVGIDYPSPLEQHPDIKKLRYQLRDYGSQCFDDGCWGYEADWEIIGNRLYLKSIRSCSCGNKNLVAKLDTIFPIVLANKMVEADWVNTEIWAPSGKTVHWADRLQRFIYQHETRYLIKKGKLISTQEFDYPTSHESALGNAPNAIAKHIYKNINWTKLPAQKPPVKSVVITVRTGATSKADSVIIYQPADEEIYNVEAKRVMESIPLGVYYWHGKVYHEYFTIRILFTEAMKNKFGTEK